MFASDSLVAGPGSGAAPAPGSPRLALDEATRERFGVRADDEVEVVIGSDHRDPWLNFAAVFLSAGLPWFTGWLIPWMSGDPSAGPAMVGGLLIATVLALLLSIGGSVMSRPHGIATGRGLHLRVKGSKDPILVPWDDVVGLDSTLPLVAEYRLELIHGAPALGALTRRSSVFGPWTTPANTRLIGSNSVWDLGAEKREAIRDAMDRHALRTFGGEADRAPHIADVEDTTP